MPAARSDLRVTLAGCMGLMLGCASAPPRSVQAPVDLKYATSKTPWLGIEMEDLPGGRPGILVARVLRGSPAAGAGLRAGDEILGLAGASLSAPTDLSRALLELDVGEEVPVAVRRAGE